jgi:mRNA-degrading endonuclease toxin of MazEF toxin-antitoxin module
MDKRRPVLILSPESRNERAADLIVVPWHVPLGRREGGLARPAVVLCEQITTLAKRRVDPAPLGGPLSESRMTEVERAILLAIGIIEAMPRL